MEPGFKPGAAEWEEAIMLPWCYAARHLAIPSGTVQLTEVVDIRPILQYPYKINPNFENVVELTRALDSSKRRNLSISNPKQGIT